MLKLLGWITLGLTLVLTITLVLGNRSALRIVSNFALDGRDSDTNVWINGRADPYDTFLRMQETVGGVPVTQGNRIEVLTDGPDTFDAMLEAIDSANNHINFETYILESGTVGERFSKALIAKANQGVQINLLYDKLGSLGLDSEFIKRLEQAGIAVRSFQGIYDLRFWRWNQRDHRKLLIIDGKIGFTGGINISDTYLLQPEQVNNPQEGKKKAWHDIHAKIEGPVVRDMQRLFLSTWLNEGGVTSTDVVYFPNDTEDSDTADKASGASEAATLVGSGRLDAESRILESYVGAIQASRHRVWITQAYFVPYFEFVQSLIDAAQRGVDVKILLPEISDNKFVMAASDAHIDTLVSAGIKLYRYDASMLHAKTAVIDGLWSTIGSSNIDIRSLEHNNEANLIVIDPNFAEKLEAVFQHDLTRSHQVELDMWRNRGIFRIAMERYAILFSYWL